MTDKKIREAAEHLGENALWLIKQILIKHDAAILEASKEAIDAAVAAEREACALVCENHPDGLNMMGGAFVACAAAIRARGKNDSRTH